METPEIVNNTLPAVIFETVLLDDKEPVRLTAALIREKSKVLTDLTIANIFDEKGYEAVKKAKAKAVKTRTTIEKMEKTKLSELKADYDEKKKEVTNYATELYAACNEAQKILEDKLKVIDDAKRAEIDRLEKEHKDRTEARDKRMFELGMLWNGEVFTGYGYSFTKETLHGYTTEYYNTLIQDIEGVKLEQEVTGNKVEARNANFPFGSTDVSTLKKSGGLAGGDDFRKHPDHPSDVYTTVGEYPTAVYIRAIPGAGVRIVITKGILEDTDADALVTNDRILESAYYIQVVR